MAGPNTLPALSSAPHFHRGKLSKSCQRCRDRRIKCDLQRPSCSSCIRVKIPCVGYRDTETIRIKNETESVRARASTSKRKPHTKEDEPHARVSHLPQDLQVIGRSMFFASYVADFTRAWDILYAYEGTRAAPDHLTLGIDAVSLAFLSHQAGSQKAKELGWQKYGAAIKTFKKALRNAEIAHEASTLESALLLDLFDKMMNPDTVIDPSSYAHVQGALALVKLRGLDKFQSAAELRALTGLECNATIYALSTGTPIPSAVREIRNHVSQFVDTSYPKWRLSEVILDGIDTETAMLLQHSSRSSICTRSIALDKRLEEVALEAGWAWSYERKFISGHDPRRIVPDDFFPLYDVYPNRTITQMWNVLRVTRILLSEQIIDALSPAEEEDSDNNADEKQQIGHATLTIITMIREILASAPQMTNCDFAAQHKLPKDSSLSKHHTHTTSHLLDVYILIYPLYVVAWSRHCPAAARTFVKNQLAHMSEHFGIKEAAVVLGFVEGQERCGGGSGGGDGGDRTDPWKVYRLLGSYAFAAV